jgi:hypothetical protein
VDGSSLPPRVINDARAELARRLKVLMPISSGE